jgi:hypothetical protein
VKCLNLPKDSDGDDISGSAILASIGCVHCHQNACHVFVHNDPMMHSHHVHRHTFLWALLQAYKNEFASSVQQNTLLQALKKAMLRNCMGTLHSEDGLCVERNSVKLAVLNFASVNCQCMVSKLSTSIIHCFKMHLKPHSCI